MRVDAKFYSQSQERHLSKFFWVGDLGNVSLHHAYFEVMCKS